MASGQVHPGIDGGTFRDGAVIGQILSQSVL
jgi:hypothetical protein